MKKVATRFAPSARSVHTEAKLAELGYTLPAVNPPKGSYVLATRSSDGNTLYTAGKECLEPCILEKTLFAMKYTVEHYNFDYLSNNL